MAAIILRHIGQRRRTVVSALGRLLVVHTRLPRLGDWVGLASPRRRRNFCE